MAHGFAFGTLHIDVGAAVELLRGYVSELEQVDDGSEERRPSIAAFEELVAEAVGADVAVWLGRGADGLSIAMNTGSRQRLDTVVRLLALAGDGEITLVGRHQRVRRYRLRGGVTAQKGRLVLSGETDVVSTW